MANEKVPDSDRLKAIAAEMSELQKSFDRQMEQLRRRLLLEAGAIKPAPAPTEFVDFTGKVHPIKYRMV